MTNEFAAVIALALGLTFAFGFWVGYMVGRRGEQRNDCLALFT